MLQCFVVFFHFPASYCEYTITANSATSAYTDTYTDANVKLELIGTSGELQVVLTDSDPDTSPDLPIGL